MNIKNDLMYSISSAFFNYIIPTVTIITVLVGIFMLILYIILYFKGTLTVNYKIFILRFGYWAGAILDLFAGINILASTLDTITEISVEYDLIMGWHASLMFGWTSLLIWADRKPIKRKIIILLTVFPVIFGIMLTNLITLNNWIINLFGLALFMICYLQAFKIEKNEEDKK